jgi:ABC-type branched-subunit amino acid transport system ATPase component
MLDELSLGIMPKLMSEIFKTIHLKSNLVRKAYLGM